MKQYFGLLLLTASLCTAQKVLLKAPLIDSYESRTAHALQPLQDVVKNPYTHPKHPIASRAEPEATLVGLDDYYDRFHSGHILPLARINPTNPPRSKWRTIHQDKLMQSKHAVDSLLTEIEYAEEGLERNRTWLKDQQEVKTGTHYWVDGMVGLQGVNDYQERLTRMKSKVIIAEQAIYNLININIQAWGGSERIVRIKPTKNTRPANFLHL